MLKSTFYGCLTYYCDAKVRHFGSFYVIKILNIFINYLPMNKFWFIIKNFFVELFTPAKKFVSFPQEEEHDLFIGV